MYLQDVAVLCCHCISKSKACSLPLILTQLRKALIFENFHFSRKYFRYDRRLKKWHLDGEQTFVGLNRVPVLCNYDRLQL